jgi:PAS domain S-box-containing protein
MKRILIVDDVEENRYLLEATLPSSGYEVVSARDGEQALALARQNPPDLIISDILMPVMDGFALCRQWRADELLRKIPFIFYTATYTDPMDEQLALDLGADRFLLKPIEPQVMIRAVAEVLAGAENGALKNGKSQQEEVVTLREYNEVLVRKLEKKLIELEESNKQLHSDNARRKLAEAELTKSHNQFSSLVEQMGEGLLQVDEADIICFANPRLCQMLEYSQSELVGKHAAALLLEEEERIAMAERNIRRSEGVSEGYEIQLRKKSGDFLPVWISATSVEVSEDGRSGSMAVITDLTDRKKQELLANGHKQVLEMIAKMQPLSEILSTLVRLIESLSPGMFCSILLLDSDKVHLRHGAAPSLPLEYTRAIDGIAIGPNVGSCGTAAYLRKLIVVEDISTDPLWADYAELALNFGLRSCWSTPILDSSMNVLGTYAMYYSEPKLPTQEHIELLEVACNTAAIAITRDQAETALQESESLFRVVADSAPVLIWMDGADKKCLYLNQPWLEFTGKSLSQGLLADWIEGIHEDDVTRCSAIYATSFDIRQPYEMEYRLRRYDGEYRWIEERAVPRYDADGNFAGYVGSCIDVTDRKLSEHQLNLSQRELLEAKDALGRTNVLLEKQVVERTETIEEVERSRRVLLSVIEDQKQAEQELRESEEKFRELVGSVEGIVWEADANSQRYSFISAQAERLLGYPIRDWLETPNFWLTHLHPDDRDNAVNHYKTCTQEMRNYESIYRMIALDGSIVWLHDFVTISVEKDGKVKHRGVMVNITKRKRAEGALESVLSATSAQLGEDFFSSLVQHLASALNVKYAFVGEFIGDDRNRVFARSVWAGEGFADPFEYDLLDTPCANVANNSLCIYSHSVQSRFPNDILLHQMGVESYLGSPLVDKAGKPIGLLVVLDDKEMEDSEVNRSILTVFGARAGVELERMRSEELVHNSEARLHAIVHTTPNVAMQGYDINGRVCLWNEASERMFGWSADEATGKGLGQLIHSPEEEAAFVQTLRGIAGTGRSEGPAEYQFRRRNGEVAWCLSTIFEIPSTEDVPMFVCMDVDITDRKRAETTRDVFLELEGNLNAARNPTEASHCIFAAADELWHVDAGFLEGYDSRQDLMSVILDFDIIDGRRQTVRSDEPSGPPGPHFRKIFSEGAKLILRTEPITRERPDSVMFGDMSQPSASLMFVPINWKGQDVGILSVQSYSINAFTNEDLKTLSSLADHCGGTLERIRAEAESHRQQEHFQTLIENASDLIIVIDKSGSIRYQSPSGERILGYASDHVIGRSSFDFVHPDDVSTAKEVLERILSNGSSPITVELRLLSRSGEWRCVEIIGRSLPAETGEGLVVLNGRDITESNKAAEALQNSEELLRLANEAASIGIYEVSFEDNRINGTDQFCAMFGLPSGSSLTIESAINDVHPDDRGQLRSDLRRSLDPTGDGIAYAEFRILNSDGTLHWVVWRGSTIFKETESGRIPSRGFGSLHDITERKMAELASKESESYKSAIFNAALDCLITIDHEGKVIDFNPAAEQTFGFSRDEVLGRFLTETIIPPYMHDAHAIGFARYMVTGTASVLNKRLQLNAVRADGTEFPIELAITRLPGEPARFTGFLRDLTESKRAEVALRLSEERLSFALEQSGIGAWDLDLIDLTANRTSIHDKIFGYETPLPTWTYDQFIEHVIPEDREDVNRRFNESTATNSNWNFECRIRRVDGEMRWISAVGGHQEDAEGNPYRLSGIVQDITERKLADTLQREHLEELQVIYGLGDAVGRADSLETVFEAAIVALIEGVKADRASVLLFDDSGVMRFKAWRGLSDAYRSAADGHSPWNQDAMDPQPVWIGNVEIEPSLRPFGDMFEKEGLKALAFIPLVHQGTLLGKFMVYFNELHVFSDSEIKLVMSIASQVAFAIARKQAEEALQMMRFSVDKAGDSVFWLSREGRILYVNDAAWSSRGYTRDELLEMSIFDLDPDYQPGVWGAHFEDLKERGTITFETRHRTKYGHIYPIEVNANYVKVAGQEFNFCFLRDISERRAAEEAVRESAYRLRTMIETEPECVKLLAVDGTLLEMNRAGLNMIEADTFMEVKDQIVYPLIDEEFRDAFRELNENVFKGVTGMLQFQLTGLKGTKRWLETHGCPLRDADGNITAQLAVTRDISERKRAEKELQELNIKLEARILERTSALALATEEAEKANLAKSDFLSHMSHEIRTPLNSVLGYAQLLEMDGANPRQLNYIDRILKGGRHLLGLIDNVLEISRIEADQVVISVEPILVTDVVRECILTLQPMSQNAGIRIEDKTRSCALSVVADRQLFVQVLINLVSNAIKFNTPDGKVVISAKSDDEFVSIVVSDTGIGISPDMQSKLFNPFERLAATGGPIQGTGLGLSLSRKLCQAMRGTIRYSTKRTGKGSIFTVILPVSKAPTIPLVEQIEYSTLSDLERFGPKTMLYIEDNLSNVELVQDFISNYRNIKLIIAMQGRMGYELAREHKPDLILLDLNLPDINGAEVLSKLKRSSTLRNTPVIILSADATSREIDRLLRMGAYSYLTKPIDVSRFISNLYQVFAERVLMEEDQID